MKVLDSLKEIRKIDKQNLLGSVESFPQQCIHAFEDASKVYVPEDYKKVKNIVMCGMGGSGLGARVIESVYAEQLKIPFVRINDYDLPAFTGKDTLVICSSYSGTTEETVSNTKQAIGKKAKLIIIGTGNTLIKLAEKYNAPYYQINPVHNPSNQPRMAIGYSVIGQLVLASKAGLFKLYSKTIQEIIDAMNKVQKINSVNNPFENNPAKKLAKKLLGKNIFYISARHLVGAMHTVNNQLNENAKTFSADFQIPELNHHLMEGLKHPNTNSEYLFMFFANSNLYTERIKKRFLITQDVVSQNNIDNFSYKLSSPNKLSQAFELMQFGGYLNLYLSVLYNQNPSPIPWVDYFKTKLGQPLGK